MRSVAARRAAVLLFFIVSLLYCQSAALRDAGAAVLSLLYYLYFLFQFILRSFDAGARVLRYRKTLCPQQKGVEEISRFAEKRTNEAKWRRSRHEKRHARGMSFFRFQALAFSAAGTASAGEAGASGDSAFGASFSSASAPSVSAAGAVTVPERFVLRSVGTRR